MGALKPQRRTQPLVSGGPVGERPAQVVGVAARLLGSFDGPEPGGPELIRKCKRELERGRERERERRKDVETQALMEQRYFISRNAGLYIFSKMITQLLHRMKFYQ